MVPGTSSPCSSRAALGARARTSEPAAVAARVGGAGRLPRKAEGRAGRLQLARLWVVQIRARAPAADLLRDVIRRSFTSVETDARRRRRKNAKALRIGIEKSERLAKQKAAAAAKAARLTKEQARAARRLAGIRFSFSSDSGTTTNDDDSPLAADADADAEDYNRCFGDPKRKRPTRKWLRACLVLVLELKCLAWRAPGTCLGIVWLVTWGIHCTPGLEHPGIIISLAQVTEIERLGAPQQLLDINHEHHR